MPDEPARARLVSPEGMRPRNRCRLPDLAHAPGERGTAHVTLRSGAPITPVLVTCEPPALMKRQPWYDVPSRELEFSLVVGDPLQAKELTRPDLSQAIAARDPMAELRSWFEERLGRGDA